ncbi:MAG: lipopolysaccharide transport system permease protein [Acidobacteriota bacterium]|jgi:lipopolysaccharide transport system permease protein|nr:lipopolysaccharide transport system permease protein [Acidobacteriota bacterium]
MSSYSYTPDSQLRAPAHLLLSMWRDLLAARGLAWRLLVRDISARYRQSLLGIFWAFLPPIATAATFIFLNNASLINVDSAGVPYPAFVITGSVFWQLFTDSFNAPLKIVEGSKSMLAKVNFPREALILSGMGQVVFDFVIRLLIVAAALAYYRVTPTWGWLLAPVALLVLMLLGTMLGMLLTPFGTLYSDVSAGLPTLLTLWLFVTPVMYPMPERWPYSLLTILNPVSPPLVAARDLVLHGAVPAAVVVPLLVVAGVSIVGLFLTWVLYRVSLPILIERMSA